MYLVAPQMSSFVGHAVSAISTDVKSTFEQRYPAWTALLEIADPQSEVVSSQHIAFTE